MSRVFVYFNLHKKTWSVKDLKTGLVILHANYVELTNCEFKVSQAGRRRVLKDRRKNVHAGVVGTLLTTTPGTPPPTFARITYDPYKFTTFINVETGAPVQKSESVKMVVTGERATVYALV